MSLCGIVKDSCPNSIVEKNKIKQDSNRLAFLYFVFIILGALYFYDLDFFPFIDELSTILLLIIMILYKDKAIADRYRIFTFFIFIVFFYILYSVIIHSNQFIPIILDALAFSKPFVAFFFVYTFNIFFSNSQKKFLVILSVILLFLMPVIWYIMPKTEETIKGTLFAGSRLTNIAFLLSALFLYCSKSTKIDWILFFLFFSIGFLRMTSKFASLFCFSIIIVTMLRVKSRQFYIWGLIGFMIALIAAFYATKDEIDFFFIEGTERSFARPVLYQTSFEIINDFIPFGSGFASFATATSGNYYSSIYYQYAIDNVYGLEAGHTNLVADTFFPALAQFGYVGIILFFMFFIWVFKVARTNYKNNKIAFYKFYVIVLILLFYLIESVTDATFISNRGFVGMLFLGIMMSDSHTENVGNRVVAQS